MLQSQPWEAELGGILQILKYPVLYIMSSRPRSSFVFSSGIEKISTHEMFACPWWSTPSLYPTGCDTFVPLTAACSQLLSSQQLHWLTDSCFFKTLGFSQEGLTLKQCAGAGEVYSSMENWLSISTQHSYLLWQFTVIWDTSLLLLELQFSSNLIFLWSPQKKWR